MPNSNYTKTTYKIVQNFVCRFGIILYIAGKNRQMKKYLFLLGVILSILSCKTSQKPAQTPKTQHFLSKTEPEKRGYWQQYVRYEMFVDMDTEKHQYTGKQKLTYKNNSYDTLTKVYYHLYWNAFQPNSAMAWKARIVPDPDRNMDKILPALKPDETGFVKVNRLLQNGQAVNYKTVGTILEVTLNQPVLPGQQVQFDMDYVAQVPIMIRRAGRNNKEGIDYSMAQWYPKLCEYDERGWHTDPYIAREFYGVWGDYDVTIYIDKKYTVAATGYLQNPEQTGKGYPTQKPLAIPNTQKLTWHFKASNVHDFSWAADPDYVHDIVKVNDSLSLHFFYQNDEKIKDNWKKLQPVAAQTMAFYNKFVGPYPYKKYSIIQAGDGGMEYAMCTFVSGNKPFNSLRGTVQHEMGHAWFQFSLASNESEYPWMDEGFTSFIQDMANVAVNGKRAPNPFEGSYQSYLYLVQQGKEEPLSTHSDHYQTNLAYWINAYDKGKLVLTQLGYIMGFDKLNQTLKNYYKNWAMKHPQPNDFFNIAEKTSGMNLKWFQNEWINTLHHIDYKVDSIVDKDSKTEVVLKNIGEMPMPIDVLVVYTDGSNESFYIPLDLMRGQKNNPFPEISRQTLPAWRYPVPQYSFKINRPKKDISAVVIDPFGFMADIDTENNVMANKKEKE